MPKVPNRIKVNGHLYVRTSAFLERLKDNPNQFDMRRDLDELQSLADYLSEHTEIAVNAFRNVTEWEGADHEALGEEILSLTGTLELLNIVYKHLSHNYKKLFSNK